MTEPLWLSEELLLTNSFVVFFEFISLKSFNLHLSVSHYFQCLYVTYLCVIHDIVTKFTKDNIYIQLLSMLFLIFEM